VVAGGELGGGWTTEAVGWGRRSRLRGATGRVGRGGPPGGGGGGRGPGGGGGPGPWAGAGAEAALRHGGR
jgi:hypothetical protein